MSLWKKGKVIRDYFDIIYRVTQEDIGLYGGHICGYTG